MRTHRFLGITVPIFLFLLWFVSGISSQKGLHLFSIGTLILIWAIVQFKRGKPRWLFTLYFVVSLLALLVGGTETVLRLTPGILKDKAAIYTYSGYHSSPSGIYEKDRHLGHALRPDVSKDIFWNGHWWHHETNSDGYRGERLDRADAIFLGDSMIYGHGVNNADTVPSRFANQTSLRVVNLGQQGTCLLQMWMRLREHASKIKPRYVFVCVHPNDITDAGFWYPESELNRFLQSEEDYLPLALSRYHPEDSSSPRRWWNQHMAPHFRVGRLMRYLFRVIKKGPEKEKKIVKSSSAVPSQAHIDKPFTPWKKSKIDRLGWKVQVKALRKIKQICEEHRATLIVHSLGYSRAFCEASKKLAEELGVSYVPAGEIALRHGQKGEPVYLINDGHWTGHGAGIVARELTEHVQQMRERKKVRR